MIETSAIEPVMRVEFEAVKPNWYSLYFEMKPRKPLNKTPSLAEDTISATSLRFLSKRLSCARNSSSRRLHVLSRRISFFDGFSDLISRLVLDADVVVVATIVGVEVMGGFRRLRDFRGNPNVTIPSRANIRPYIMYGSHLLLDN